jgi:hypothetical protein
MASAAAGTSATTSSGNRAAQGSVSRAATARRLLQMQAQQTHLLGLQLATVAALLTAPTC